MAQDNWVGKTIAGRYQIDDLLGQGGMSAVYKATDPNLRRVVAVKLIHGHLSNNQEFVRRFEEEAAAVAQLRHPNIIQVFDFDEDDGTYYMVLEFVPGETLQDRLKRLDAAGRHLPIDKAIEFIASVCDAADYAHKRGMIHRDIKPANVMLNVQGQAILMDFGIAKMLGGQRHTATGAVIGTALYMSPEQIQGQQPDARADIYSIGVMLFEALSGRPPYDADSAMTLMMMHLNDPVPNLKNVRSDVPPALAAVIEKALAKKREDRFQSAAEMAEALRSVQMGASSQEAVGATMIETPTVKAPPQPDATFVESGPFVAPAGGAPAQSPYAAQPAATVPAGRGAMAPDATFVEQPTMPMPPSGGSPPAGPRAAAPASRPKKGGPNLMVIGGIVGFVLLVIVIGGAALAYSIFGGGGDENTPLAIAATATEPGQVAAVATDAAPTNTLPPTETQPPTATLPPTETPLPTSSPTPTIPPGIPYVQITNITIDGGYFVVEYETYEYTEALPGTHIHFFYDTVTPEQAGVPGSGPWKLYGGPRPFKGYATNSRPNGATMMCALVANPNHSVQMNSGTCFPLPDIQ